MSKLSEIMAYVGTYTNGDSKGIYRFTMNTEDGTIHDIKLAAEADNPTYLAIDKNNRFIYSVIKVDERGGAAVFSIDNISGDLRPVNYIISDGKPPCYVSLDDKDKYLFTANYHKGSVEVFKIGENSELQCVLSTVRHEGSGPDKKRQEKAHVHYASLTPDKKHVCVIDLGTDKLSIYNLDNGVLSEAKELSLHLKPGCGPRHMEFHPSGKFAYVITELSGEIVVLEYVEADCSLREIQYTSTVPSDYNGENFGGAIHISHDGRYLYSSNRGHDSITVFKIDECSGKLQLISNTSTEGIYPRDFAIDPTGSFIAAANQKSSNIAIFSIDKENGSLTFTGTSIYIPNPVCIKFKLADMDN